MKIKLSVLIILLVLVSITIYFGFFVECSYDTPFWCNYRCDDTVGCKLEKGLCVNAKQKITGPSVRMYDIGCICKNNRCEGHSNEPEINEPTKENPITLSRDHIIIRSNEEDVLRVVIFNSGSNPITVMPRLTCEDLNVQTNVKEKTIESNLFEVFTLSFTFNNATLGPHLCQIEADYGNQIIEKDFTVDIRV